MPLLMTPAQRIGMAAARTPSHVGCSKSIIAIVAVTEPTANCVTESSTASTFVTKNEITRM